MEDTVLEIFFDLDEKAEHLGHGQADLVMKGLTLSEIGNMQQKFDKGYIYGSIQ